MILFSVVLFIVLILLGLDIGFAMITAAMIGMLFKGGGGVDIVQAPLSMLGGIDETALVAIPLFILAGELMNRGGVTLRLINWSMAMVGHMRGSLSQVSLTTNLVMAGISGSAVADASAIGTAMIPSMKSEGYRRGYPEAVIACGAMLGPILPPSIPMIVYAVLANLSIIRLFLAGIIPGFMLLAGYMAICAWQARRHGYKSRPRASWPERAKVTRASIWALLMPVLIIVGIRFGLLTDTEAAAFVAVYALLVGLAVYRELKLGELGSAFYAAGRTMAVVLFLLAAAGPFSWLISESRIAATIAKSILSISEEHWVVLLTVNVFLILVGKILEPLPAMIITLPALLPIGAQLGLDPIQYAMILILNLMTGMLTPPVGILLFVTSAVGRTPIGPIVREIIPFFVWSLIVLALICAFPPLTLWLPGLGG
ncbi:MAG: TRAP transporter large permease [Achromobacter veterisilvae]